MARRKQERDIHALIQQIYHGQGPSMPLIGVSYERVSTTKQARSGTSLEIQPEDIRVWAERHHIRIVQHYVDRGWSARSSKRPEYQRMLQQLDTFQVKVVLVWKLDRFARNMLLQLQALDNFTKQGIVLISITEMFDYSRWAGKMSMVASAMIAEMFSNQLSERMERTTRFLAEQGIWVGPVPLGYKRPEGPKNPLQFSADIAAIQMAFELYATRQYSYSTLSKALNDQGYTVYNQQTAQRVPFTKTNIREILGNPVYLGKVRFHGEIFEGQHPPAISEALWNQVQQIIKERGSHTRSYNPNKPGAGVVSGLVRCSACNAPMWRNNSHTRWPYYLCSGRWNHTCDAPFIRANDLDADATNMLAAFQLPREWRTYVAEAVQSYIQQQQNLAQRDPMLLADIERKQSHLLDIYLEGLVDRSQFEAKKADLDKQAEHLLTVATGPKIQINLDTALGMLEQLPALVRRANEAQRRALMHEIFEAVWAERDRGFVGLQVRETYLPLVLAILKKRAVDHQDPQTLGMVGRVGYQPTPPIITPPLWQTYRVPIAINP